MSGQAQPHLPEDGVIVHGALVRQDGRGSWWALGDKQRVMFSVDCDDILRQIADARRIDTDAEGLRDDLARAVAQADRQRAEDALYKQRKAARRRHG